MPDHKPHVYELRGVSKSFAMTAALREVGASDATGVILAANGPVFSAGHNFGDMAGATVDAARHLFDVCTEMMDTVQTIPQVVVARVHALATAAAVRTRMAEYRAKTEPILPLYDARGLVSRVDGMASIEDVTDAIAAIVG